VYSEGDVWATTLWTNASILIAKEIQHIFQRAAFCFIHLSIIAPCAGNGSKFLVLDVKEFP